MYACANVCVGLSLAAVLILPVWAALLFSKSMALELPDAKKGPAGRACLFTVLLYIFSGLASALYIRHRCLKHSEHCRRRRPYSLEIASGRIRCSDPATVQPLLSNHS